MYGDISAFFCFVNNGLNHQGSYFFETRKTLYYSKTSEIITIANQLSGYFFVPMDATLTSVPNCNFSSLESEMVREILFCLQTAIANVICLICV